MKRLRGVEKRPMLVDWNALTLSKGYEGLKN